MMYTNQVFYFTYPCTLFARSLAPLQRFELCFVCQITIYQVSLNDTLDPCFTSISVVSYRHFFSADGTCQNLVPYFSRWSVEYLRSGTVPRRIYRACMSVPSGLGHHHPLPPLPPALHTVVHPISAEAKFQMSMNVSANRLWFVFVLKQITIALDKQQVRRGGQGGWGRERVGKGGRRI